jgi:hypothetical protein
LLKKEWAQYQSLRPLREEILFYISQTTHAAEIFPRRGPLWRCTVD